MKFRKVVSVSAGNKPAAPIMDGEEETTGKTASLLDEEPSEPHHRRLEQVAREVKWEWKRESAQGHGERLRMRLSYKRTIFQDIKSVLTEVTKKQFVDGCFGHLMGFIGGTNCIKALYELIAREIDAPGAEEGLWFRVGGTNIRFSPKEYALVTGLRFGSSTFDPLGSHEIPKDGVCKRCFRGRSITIGELLEKFNSDGVRDGSPQDYLKVANVLALYLMVLGYDKRKTVEKWVWVLVEDLDSWNRFPWGAYAYQALRHFVRSLPKTREDLDKTSSFLGPMWALQIWAYEAIPKLGKTCASVFQEDKMPRCLKWEYLSTKIALAPNFFEEIQSCFMELDPTDHEKLRPYWASVLTTQPLGVGYSLPQRRRPRRAGTRDTLDESVSWQEQHSSDSDDCARSPSPCWKCTRAPTHSHRVPQGGDEARFVERVSDRVVERLSQQLIQIKQLIESMQSPSQPQPSREVHDELEMMHDTSFLHENPPGICAESAKGVQRKTEKQSCDGGSSSMNISRKAGNGQFTGEKTKPVQKDAFGGEEQLEGLSNAPRLHIGVSGGAKSSENQKDAIHDQIGSTELEMMQDISFVHAKPPGNYAEREKEKQSNEGGSTSMNFSRNTDNGHLTGEKTKPVQKDAFGGEEQSKGLDNAPRLDAGVSGAATSSANRKDAIDQNHIGSSERLKGEVKRTHRTSPHREGDEANIAKKKKDKNKKNKRSSMSKQRRQSPSSSEDEESESSSDNERRRKPKKRSKRKKKRKYSESSSSESSPVRDRRRRKRNRHRRHRSSPSDSEASDSESR